MEVCDDQGEELNVKRKKPNFFIKKKEVEVEVEVMFLYFSLAIFVFLLLFLAPLSLLHRIHSMRRSGGRVVLMVFSPCKERDLNWSPPSAVAALWHTLTHLKEAA